MFRWLQPKLKTSEKTTIKTSINFYDTPTDVNLYWEDVLEVLNLAENGSVESINQLKSKYKLVNKYGNDLYVNLHTPKIETYSSDVYPGESWDFSLKDLQRIYQEEIEYRDKRKEWDRQKKIEQEEYRQRNTVQSLQEEIKSLDLKRK